MKPVRGHTTVIASLGLLLLAACASFQDPGHAGNTTRSILPDSSQFHPGLTGAEMQAILGSPESTKRLPSGGTVWTYRYRVATDVKAVPISTVEVPAINPITGQPITRTEQVYENHATDFDVFLHLLLVDDRLVEWRFIRQKTGSFQ
ncbi:MAG TPA: hypothetical protein VG936_13180 [Lacunisphaera sp.]|nr:hypothetical protein [Lacunisphaera sp.]